MTEFDKKLEERIKKYKEIEIRVKTLIEEFQAFNDECMAWLSTELSLEPRDNKQLPAIELVQKARKKQC